MNISTPHSIILFDDECGLCSSWVHFIKKQDRYHKFQYLALQSEQGQTMLESYGLPANSLSTVVYIKNDRHYLRSTAALSILKDLGGWWKGFYIFMMVPAPIRNFVYNVVAKNRHRFFGKQNSCKL